MTFVIDQSGGDREAFDSSIMAAVHLCRLFGISVMDNAERLSNWIEKEVPFGKIRRDPNLSITIWQW